MGSSVAQPPCRHPSRRRGAVRRRPRRRGIADRARAAAPRKRQLPPQPILHSSSANTSGRRRRGYAVQLPAAALRLHEAGSILTKPVTWPGGELLVNADPRRDITSHHSGDDGTYGSIRVEVRDAENKPLDGYGFADCNPINRNTRNFDEEPVWTMPERDQLAVKPLTWQGGRSARDLAGKRIRLFFEVRDAHLYSFRAGTPSFRASST